MNQPVVTKTMTVDELWDQYVADTIYDWDIYQEWTKSDIEQILSDEGVEYTTSDIDGLYELMIETQNDMITQDKETCKEELRHIMEDSIIDSDYSEHLSNDEIGKILVSLANSYFND